MVSQDSMNTRNGNKTNTKENKEKAKELLKTIGIKPEYVSPPTIAEIITPDFPEIKSKKKYIKRVVENISVIVPNLKS